MLPMETFNMRKCLHVFPGKTETERRSNFENFWAVYGDMHYAVNSFCEGALQIAALWPGLWIEFFFKSYQLFSYFYCTWFIDKYTGEIIIIHILINSVFCVLNLMFPACSPDLAKVVCTKWKVKQAWWKVYGNCTADWIASFQCCLFWWRGSVV